MAFNRHEFTRCLLFCAALWTVGHVSATCVSNTTSSALNATNGELIATCGIGGASGLAKVVQNTDCSITRTPEAATCVCRLGFFPGPSYPCEQNRTVTRYCTPSELQNYCSASIRCIRTCLSTPFINSDDQLEYNCTRYLNESCFTGQTYRGVQATTAQMVTTCGPHYVNPTPLVGTCHSFTVGGGYSNCTFNETQCQCSHDASPYFRRVGYPPCQFDYGVYPCNATDIASFCGDQSVNCTKRCLQPTGSVVRLEPFVGMMYNTSIVAALTTRCQAKFGSSQYHFAPNRGETCVSDGTSQILQNCPCVPGNMTSGTLNLGCLCYKGIPGTGDYLAANAYCGSTAYGIPCTSTCTPSVASPSCHSLTPPTSFTGPGTHRGTGFFDVPTCTCIGELPMTQTGLDYINQHLCPTGQVIDLSNGQCVPFIGPCTEADVCVCQPGYNSTINPQYCQYRYEADVCLVPDGEARDVDACGVLVETAYFECPTSPEGFVLTGSEACRPVCRCRQGTGRTPTPTGWPSLPCDGADRACNVDDIALFCGAGYSACTKRCQYGVLAVDGTPADPWEMGLCVFITGSCVVSSAPEYLPCTAAQFRSCGTATRSCTQGYVGGVAVGSPRCVCTEDGFRNATAPCDSWSQYTFQSAAYCEAACDPGWLYCAQRRFLLHVVPNSFSQAANLIVNVWGLLRYDKTQLKWYDNMTAVRLYGEQQTLISPFYVTVCGCDASILRGPVGSAQPSFTPSVTLPPLTSVHWVAGTSLPTNPQLDWSSIAGYDPGTMIDTTWGAGLDGRLLFDFYSGYPSTRDQFFPSIIDYFYHVVSCQGPSLQTTPSYPQTLVEAVDNFQRGFYYAPTQTIYRDPGYLGWCSGLGVPGLLGVDIKNYRTDALEGDQATFRSQLQTLAVGLMHDQQPNGCVETDPFGGDPNDVCINQYGPWVAAGGLCSTDEGKCALLNPPANQDSCNFCGQFPEFVAFYQMTRADDVEERTDIMVALNPTTQLAFVNSMVVIYDNILSLEAEILASQLGNDRVSSYYAAFHTSLTQSTLGLGLEFQAQTAALSFYPGLPGLNIQYHNSTTVGRRAPITLDPTDFTPYYKIAIFNKLLGGCNCLWRDNTHQDCSCNSCCDFALPGQTQRTVGCHETTDNCARLPNFARQAYLAAQSLANSSCPLPVYDTGSDCIVPGVQDYIRYCNYNGGSGCSDSCTANLIHTVAEHYCYNGTFMVSLAEDNPNSVHGSCACDVGWYADPSNGRCTFEECGTTQSGAAVTVYNPYTRQNVQASLQLNGECNGHGHHNEVGACVCDYGWLPPCCRQSCADAVNSAGSCDSSYQHVHYCDYNNTAAPRWVCNQTPEGFWDQPCCQNFIWYATETPVCAYQTTVTAPNGTIVSITPRPTGLSSFGEVVINQALTLNATRTFSRPFCLCLEPWTGPFCNISSCPSTVGGGICNGKGTCIGGSCQQVNPLTGAIQCMINGIPTGYAGCSCEEDITDECFDSASGELCGGPTRGTCVLLPVQPLRYGCQCTNGFSGTLCATPPCDSSHCNAPVGGTCLYNESPPRCQCFNSKSGTGQNLFEGPYCNISVTATCGATPGSNQLIKCGGHGQCVYSDGLGGYHCTCDPGYSNGPLGPCTIAPCIPACNHGICDTSVSPPQCRCYKHWSLDSNGNRCAQTDCAPIALPSPLDSMNSVCQCLDNTTTFESGCTLKRCPVATAQNGYTCGQVHPLFQSTCQQTTTCPSASCNCCNNGTCSCHWSSRLNPVTGVCDPICDLTHTVDITSTEQCAGSVCTPVFTGCVCQSGYDPTQNCTQSYCENGGVLGPDGSTCICLPQYSGPKCEIDTCHGVGLWNFTSGRCNCYFPFVGDDCHLSRCQNGAATVPDGPNAPNYKCVCPSSFTGTFCQVDRCAISGGGYANATGNGCVCTSSLEGAFCNMCLAPNTNVSGVCTCDAQYTGPQCQFRRCGPQGLYNTTTGNCTCGGVSLKNPYTGNCTWDACGPFGTASTNFASCSCVNGSVLVSMLDTNHSVWCMPVCLNGGTYDNLNRRCSCPSGTVQPFCARPSSSSSSSSTGGAGPGSSSSSSTGSASHGASSSSSSGTHNTAHSSSSSSTGGNAFANATSSSSSSSTGTNSTELPDTGTNKGLNSSVGSSAITLFAVFGAALVGVVAFGIYALTVGTSAADAAADIASAAPLMRASVTATATPTAPPPPPSAQPRSFAGIRTRESRDFQLE